MINEQINASMNEWMNERTDERTNGPTNRRINERRKEIGVDGSTQLLVHSLTITCSKKFSSGSVNVSLKK